MLVRDTWVEPRYYLCLRLAVFGLGKPTDVILEVFIIKALFLNEDLTLSLEETEKPTLQNPTDVIIKVSAASICGSDIHFITGEVALYPNDRFIIGHEGVGVVEEVGSMVTKFKPGDRVAIPAGIACGDCIQCREGRIYACEMNTLFGHGRIKGNLPGLQSEYVRMPLADRNLVHIPDSVTDKEVLLVGDVLSTGYIGVINGKPKPGEDIAIFGAGPVGLCAVASAKLFSPSRIILVDLEDYRLEAGLKLGATHVINAASTNAAKEVMKITKGVGAQVSVDAAAFPETINNCLACTAKGGTVSVIGISPWKIEFNMGRMFFNNLTLVSGYTSLHEMEHLVKMIEFKRLDTTPIITHEFKLSNILEAYRVFQNRLDNCIKVMIVPD